MSWHLDGLSLFRPFLASIIGHHQEPSPVQGSSVLFLCTYFCCRLITIRLTSAADDAQIHVSVPTPDPIRGPNDALGHIDNQTAPRGRDIRFTKDSASRDSGCLTSLISRYLPTDNCWIQASILSSARHHNQSTHPSSISPNSRESRTIRLHPSHLMEL